MLNFNAFLQGALVMGCGIIGLFFLKFWRQSRDRLFVFFGLAFWILGANWLALAFSNVEEPNAALYVPRLVAFLLILIGIGDKNRVGRPRKSDRL